MKRTFKEAPRYEGLDDYMVKPEDRMTCKEIRYFHRNGSSVQILAELNACSTDTIKRILAGEDIVWNPVRPMHRVVNVDEGWFYPSVRECERREGIKKGSLNQAFVKRGPRIIFKGTRYHRY